MAKVLKQQFLECFCSNIQTVKDKSTTRLFTLEEANNLILTKILGEALWFTSLYDRTVINFYKTKEDLVVLDEKLNHIKKMWDDRIESFGAIPEGIGVVDFNAGDNMRFCWKYYNKRDPRFENCILYWHKVGEGFSKRIPIKYFPKESKDELSAIQLIH